MARVYNDISHFRAPFKNWPYLGAGGLGATVIGTTADGQPLVSLPSTTGTVTTVADPTVPVSPTDPSLYIDTDSKGVRVFKPALADLLMKSLAAYATIFLDNDSVILTPAVPNDVRPLASAWAAGKLAAGKTIVGGASVGGVPQSAQYIALPGTDKILRAIAPSDEASVTGGVTPLMAVIARSSVSTASMFGLGPVGMAAVALLAVGGVFLLMGKGKKHRGSDT